MNPAKPRIRMVCSHCGSENVTRDASASWSIEAQAWVLKGVMDTTYCEVCNDVSALNEVALRPVFQVTGAGFSANTDATDDRVLWIEADNFEQAAVAIHGLKCSFVSTGIPLRHVGPGCVDFRLPADTAALRERLQHFCDNPPTKED